MRTSVRTKRLQKVESGGSWWSVTVTPKSTKLQVDGNDGLSGHCRYMADIGQFRSTDQKVAGSNPAERAKSPGQRAVKSSCGRNRANIACPSVSGEPRKPMSGDSYGPCSPLANSQHWTWSSMGFGEANWDALPRSPSDGREIRRSAGLRSSRLSARGILRTQASTWPRPRGPQHCGTAGGSPPLVWQLGRCRHGTTSGVTPAT